MSQLLSELNIEADVGKLPQVLAFIDENLESADCPIKAQMQIDVAVEEIFVNIAQYAYAPKTGTAKISLQLSEKPKAIAITFADRGIPYNPLAKAEPDVTLSAEERPIGGLGIFMTKQFMDDAAYVFKDGQNQLTLTKRL